MEGQVDDTHRVGIGTRGRCSSSKREVPPTQEGGVHPPQLRQNGGPRGGICMLCSCGFINGERSIYAAECVVLPSSLPVCVTAFTRRQLLPAS